jgi:tetratricopeptide (TPR) repeat protein
VKHVETLIWTTCALLMFAAGCRSDAGAREARHLAVGQRCMEKKDFARAVLEFRNATQLSPRSDKAHYHLGLALLAVGDMRTAVQHLMTSTSINPQNAQAQAKLAELMATSRNPEVLAEARKRARAAMDADPDAVASLDAMAIVEWNRESPEVSEQHLERALQKVPGHMKSAVMLANIKLTTRDYDGAEQVLRDAVKASPESPELRVVLGNLYRFLKRPEKAEEELQAALRTKPDYAPALLDLARLRVATNRKPEAEEVYKRIAALPEKSYRPAYALYLLHLVDVKRGIVELERLYREDPQSRDIRSRLVSAYLADNRTSEAEQILAAVIAKNNRDVPALLQRAELLIKLGRYQAAEQDVNKVLQYDATVAAAHVQLAQVFAARNEKLRQKQELAEALRLEPAALPVRLSLAGEHLRTRAPKAALEVLSQAPENQRRSPDFIKARNWALLASGDLAQAAKGIDAGMALGQDPELTLQAANLRLRQKDAVRARSLLAGLVKQRPDDVRVLQAMMDVYASTGQLQPGLAWLKGHAAGRKTSAPVQMFLATWLRGAGDVKGALAAAGTAAEADPAGVAPRLIAAELELIENRVDSARRMLNSLTPNDRTRPEAVMLFAALEQQAGNYSQCIEHLRSVVAARPRSVAALNNLAYLLVDYANRPDEGLQYAQRVKELAPDDSKVEDTIGWAYFAKGLYPTAVAHLERAVAQDAKTATPLYHLAMAYQRNGDPVKARQVLAAATKLDPAAPERRRAAEILAATPSPTR